MSLQYRSIADDQQYGAGVGDFGAGLPNAYFPLRKGCDLTLYNDAHQVRLLFILLFLMLSWGIMDVVGAFGEASAVLQVQREISDVQRKSFQS